MKRNEYVKIITVTETSSHRICRYIAIRCSCPKTKPASLLLRDP